MIQYKSVIILTDIFAAIDKLILKFMRKFKGPRIGKTIWKKKLEEICFPVSRPT